MYVTEDDWDEIEETTQPRRRGRGKMPASSDNSARKAQKQTKRGDRASKRAGNGIRNRRQRRTE